MDSLFDWPGFMPEFALGAGKHGFRECVLANLAAGHLAVWERPENGPTIYVSAGIHGDEPAGPLALLELLGAGFFGPGIHWLVAPTLNPDGLAAGTRGNPAGCDLNRDFLKRHSPEISALATWLASIPPPDLFLSLHEDCETSGFYFYEINQGADHPDRAAAILNAVRPWFSPQSGPDIDGHLPRTDGWIYHEPEADEPDGWPEAIFLAKLGCPLSFTFETPSQSPLPQRVAALQAAVRSAFGSVRW